MKIKYIGNFNDGTGWAKAATYNALALASAGHDIYCEEFKYNQMSVMLEPEIQNLTEKKSDKYDAVVYHLLPTDYRYDSSVKNIGFVSLETLTLSSVPWLKKISMMDEIWVPNNASKRCLINSGIENDKIKVFPHTFNFYKTLEVAQNSKTQKELSGTFNFVFNGEFTKRKNLEALLFAFHNEFDFIEPVNVFIKTSKNPNQVIDFCNAVKTRMKKRGKYKSEIVATGYMSEADLFGVIKNCHAFVMPSYGEAWCYPALEAMTFGIPPIYTKGIGIEDFDSSGFFVDSRVTPCYGANDTFDFLYTSDDFWLEIDIMDLQKKLRQVYELQANPKEFNSLKEICTMRAKQFHFTNTEITRGII